MTSRIRALDIIKGFAIVIVIADHTQMTLPALLDSIEVPVFFIISGILFSVADSPKDFFVKKWWRLLIPYLFFCAISVPIAWTRTQALWPTFYHSFFDTVNYPLWFIRTLFLASFLFYPIARLKTSHPRLSLLLAAASFPLAIAAAAFDWPRRLVVFAIPQALEALPLMAAGFWAKPLLLNLHHALSKASWKLRVAWAALAIVLAIVVSLLARPSALFDGKLMTPLSAAYPLMIAACAAAIILALVIQKSPPLEFLGRHSLSIFGCHAFILLFLVEIGLESKPAILLLTLVILVPTVLLLQRFIPRLVGYNDKKSKR